MKAICEKKSRLTKRSGEEEEINVKKWERGRTKIIREKKGKE
jgi:hypothetical protein